MGSYNPYRVHSELKSYCEATKNGFYNKDITAVQVKISVRTTVVEKVPVRTTEDEDNITRNRNEELETRD